MSSVFLILAILTGVCAVAAVSLRNLVHCALALTLTFAGLAGLYLELHAQFVGFAQVLVYVGAVAILIVFAILLTRGAEPAGISIASKSWYLGGGVSVLVFAVLGRVILTSKALGGHTLPTAEVTVRQIGDQLMTRYVLPLEVLGLLLTAALIGAVIIALKETPVGQQQGPKTSEGALPSTNGHEASESPAWRMEGRPDGVALSADARPSAAQAASQEATR